MCSDAMPDILMATIRCVTVLIINRRYLKFLAFSGYILFGVLAKNISNVNAASDEVISRVKTHIDLPDEQESKMRLVIEEKTSKRKEIVKNFFVEENPVRTQLQQLRWFTDM